MMIQIETKIDIPEYIQSSIRSLLGSVIDKDITVSVAKRTKRRSLDANAYYWRLVTKLAKINDITNARQHNLLLRDYGQVELIDGQLIRMPIPDTEAAEIKALEAEEYHIKPTSQVIADKDGIQYRNYIMMRGSSAYDAAEMARLISGLIVECRQMEIPESEIMTLNEQEALRQKWGIDV